MTRASQLRMQLFRYFPALLPQLLARRRVSVPRLGCDSERALTRVLRNRSVRLKGALLLSHTFGNLSRVFARVLKDVLESSSLEFLNPLSQPSPLPLALGD